MQKENNYIFINKKADTAVSISNIKKILCEAFELLSFAFKLDDDFSCWSAKRSLSIGKSKAQVYFQIKNIKKHVCLDISVESKSLVKCIRAMEIVHKELQNIERIKQFYLCITSYDSISEYYCKRIYPLLAIWERKLRRLMYNVYIAHFGIEFCSELFDEKESAEIKSIIKFKGNKTEKRENYVKEVLYNININIIENILFIEKWTNAEDEKRLKLLDENNKIKDMSDDKIREIIDELHPRCDWERFFSNQDSTMTTEEVKLNINFISKMRNKVAHNKLFTKDEFSKTKTALDLLICEIDKAIITSNKVDFANINAAAVLASTTDLLASLAGVVKLQELFKKTASSIKPLMVAASELAAAQASFNSLTSAIMPLKSSLANMSNRIEPIAKENAIKFSKMVENSAFRGIVSKDYPILEPISSTITNNEKNYKKPQD